MLKSLITIFCFLFQINTIAHQTTDRESQVEQNRMRYKILSNKIRYSRRNIDILMREEDFTVVNLKVLMANLFTAYPKPERLWVFVATDISQLGDLAEFSDPSKRPAALHPSGGLYRERETDSIRFRFPNGKLQTIIIKEKTARNRGKPQSLIRR